MLIKKLPRRYIGGVFCFILYYSACGLYLMKFITKLHPNFSNLVSTASVGTIVPKAIGFRTRRNVLHDALIVRDKKSLLYILVLPHLSPANFLHYVSFAVI